MSDIVKKTTAEIVLPAEKLEYLQRELTNVREDLFENKYISEARIVLQAGGLRSAIGCYWNAVSDDLRRKVMHRSLDLFNKEMNKNVKTYEDFQNHVTDNDLIDGAYKIGALSWEAKKIMHQARETRNIFDGHPDSSDPSLFKVLNMIADCNRYVLSQEYPIPIINVNDYILKMDTDSYDKHDLAVEQAFVDLPEIYKGEMCNKLFTYYLSNTISTRFRANIEFSYPILWRVTPKEIRIQVGQRFDKMYLAGDAPENEKGIELPDTSWKIEIDVSGTITINGDITEENKEQIKNMISENFADDMWEKYIQTADISNTQYRLVNAYYEVEQFIQKATNGQYSFDDINVDDNGKITGLPEKMCKIMNSQEANAKYEEIRDNIYMLTDYKNQYGLEDILAFKAGYNISDSEVSTVGTSGNNSVMDNAGYYKNMKTII